MDEWNFSREVISEANEITIGSRVAVHWSEAECQDQEGTVVGVRIGRYGKVEYAVHIDGDISPTDEFTHDRSGREGGTIRLIAPAPLSALPGEAEVVERLRKLTSPDAEMLSDGYRLTEIIKLNPADALQAMQARVEAAEEANKALMAERTNLIETKRQQIEALDDENHDLHKKMRQEFHRAEAAEARVKELEEALEPFAKAADFIERDYGADTPDAQMQFPQITMLELRRARTTLSSIGASNG
jgi:hypothetical protein